jgi:hypothetical protein
METAVRMIIRVRLGLGHWHDSLRRSSGLPGSEAEPLSGEVHWHHDIFTPAAGRWRADPAPAGGPSQARVPP